MRPFVVAVITVLLAAAPAAAQDGPPQLGPLQVVNLASERTPQYRPLIGSVVPAGAQVVFCHLAGWERVGDSRWTIEWLRDGAVIDTVTQAGDPAWGGMPAGSIVGPVRVPFAPWRVLAAAELGHVMQCRVTVTTPFGTVTQSAYPLRLFGDGTAAPGEGDAASAASLSGGRRSVAGVLRRGSFAIRARLGGTQPATLRASSSGRLVASGTALPDGAGLKPVTLRLTAAGKRLLRREGSVKVQLAIGTRTAIQMTLKR